MNLTVDQYSLSEDVTAVSVRGEVDIASAPFFRKPMEETAEQARRGLVLNLDHATYLDSQALAVILSVLKRLRGKSCQMAIVCTNPTTLRLFHITGVDVKIPVFATDAEALAAMDEKQQAEP